VRSTITVCPLRWVAKRREDLLGPAASDTEQLFNGVAVHPRQRGSFECPDGLGQAISDKHWNCRLWPGRLARWPSLRSFCEGKTYPNGRQVVVVSVGTRAVWWTHAADQREYNLGEVEIIRGQ
jgi:hypothetical protein